MGPRERGGEESSVCRDVHGSAPRCGRSRCARRVWRRGPGDLLSASWTWCQRPWHTVPRSVGLGQGGSVLYMYLTVMYVY